MSTGKLIFIITMGWTLIISGGIAYLFKRKRDFTFLSGFSNRSEEDKEFLEENGYLSAIGNLLATSFWILLITFIAGLLSIPWAFEICITIFILHLMIGLVWIQRYEVPHKRKKMLWITGTISAGTIILIAVIVSIGLSIGFGDNQVNIDEDTFEITGMYGVEWSLKDIENVELIDELPEIIMRTNGYSSPGTKKGKFKLEEPYGKGLLFINGNEGPYLAIFHKTEYVILNRDDQTETIEIYEKLLVNTNEK